MEFEYKYFCEYKELMDTTNIQKCYQQMIQLIKYISAKLEREMPDYHFMGRVVENQMDFSYFQATTEKLKKQGLKIQVVFVHKTCEFEVWMSGYNRKVQCRYYNMISDLESPLALCANPERNDYIAKLVLTKNIITDDPETIISEMQIAIKILEESFLKY